MRIGDAGAAGGAGRRLRGNVGSDDERQLSNLAVTLTALVVGLAGWVLLTLLERWTDRARSVWTVTAAVVFAVSLLGPLGAVTARATAVLIGLHVLVAAILIEGLLRTTRRDQGPGRAVPTDPPGDL